MLNSCPREAKMVVIIRNLRWLSGIGIISMRIHMLGKKNIRNKEYRRERRALLVAFLEAQHSAQLLG